MTRPLAFVLNLDAELELEAGARYQRAHAMNERVTAIAKAMTVPGAVIDPLHEKAPPDAAAIAWCPTPSASRAIEAAGLALPAAPPFSVLAKVNARPFAFALGSEELPGSILAHDLETARAALARPGAWLLKRAFGVSGRGQRPVRGGEFSEADASFVAASIRKHGSIVIEPRVVIERELSVHAWQEDRTHVRSIRAQRVDAYGAFVASEHARDLDGGHEARLVETAMRVGAALGDAGYTGPFGIDAFVHSGGALRTLSEINARYCMGWDDVDGWLSARYT